MAFPCGIAVARRCTLEVAVHPPLDRGHNLSSSCRYCQLHRAWRSDFPCPREGAARAAWAVAASNRLLFRVAARRPAATAAPRQGGNLVSKASRNREVARAKVAEMRAREVRQDRRRKLFTGVGAAVLAIVAAVAITLAVMSGKGSNTTGSHPALKLGSLSALGALRPPPSPGTNGFEGVPIPAAAQLAGTSNAAKGAKVDGIRCQRSEQLIFHIHAHLTIFINGQARQVPAGVGIPGSSPQSTSQGVVASGGTCLYWLHTHAPDGIIHIESPIHRIYTLGDFFDEWGQPLGPSVLGPDHGHVVAIYNGKLYEGNPRDIPLNAHAQIQLEVGKPLIAPEIITWPAGL